MGRNLLSLYNFMTRVYRDIGCESKPNDENSRAKEIERCPSSLAVLILMNFRGPRHTPGSYHLDVVYFSFLIVVTQGHQEQAVIRKHAARDSNVTINKRWIGRDSYMTVFEWQCSCS